MNWLTKMTDPTPGGKELLEEAKALGLNIFYTNLTGGKMVIQYRDKNGETRQFRKRSGVADRRMMTPNVEFSGGAPLYGVASAGTKG